MTSNERVKDFAAFEEQPYKGMIVPEMFNDTGDDGSGFPGLQRAVYNRMTWWLHSGNMDSGLHLNSNPIWAATFITGIRGYFSTDITGVAATFTNAKITNLVQDINLGGAYDIKGAAEITGTIGKFTTFNLLPIGTVLMYRGSALGGDLSTRTEQIGDHGSDTITMLGWYVCNGQSGTPNLINKFIRCEATVGNVGGEDTHTLTTDELPSHTHSAAGAHTHSSPRTTSSAGEHGHTINAVNAGAGARGAPVGLYADTTEVIQTSGAHTHTVNIASDGSHTHDNVGSDAAHENRPSYYSLVFITRVS